MGCDGNDIPLFGPEEGTEETTYSGQFLDSVVTNLDYRTATQTGTTDGAGRFSYREGETVTFSIGGVILGTAKGQPIITPVNLITNGSSSTPAVQNIARFLLALDGDDNPRNGINLSSDLKTAAAEWGEVDFSAADFATEVGALLDAAGSVEGRTVTLPSASEARYHLEQTIYCAYGGAFSGTFTDPAGYDGEWIALVDTSNGGIIGTLRATNGASFQMNGNFFADAAGTFSVDIYPQNTLTRWQGKLTSSGRLLTDSGNASGNREMAELPEGSTQGTLFKGALARGTQDEITDIYALTFAINGSNIIAMAYSLTSNVYVDVQAVSIDADRVQLTVDGINLIAGGIENGDYVTISGIQGNEQIGGTACQSP